MARINEFLDAIFQTEAEDLPEREKQIRQTYGDSLFGQIHEFLTVDPDRTQRYADFDEMDARNPLIAKSLDIIAEEAVPLDPRTGMSFWVEAEKDDVQRVVDRMLERVRFDEIVGDISRDMPKYGEQIRKVVYITPEEASELSGSVIGIVALEEIDALGVNPRLEFGRLTGWEIGHHGVGHTPMGPSGSVLPPWDFWHTRVPGRSAMRGRVFHAFHGRSSLEAARPIWRAVKVSEDSMLLARVTRAVQQRVFMFPADGVAPEEIPALINEYKRLMNRRFQIKSSGEFAQRVNIFAYDEDLFWPTVQGMTSRVETIGGVPDIRAIEDLRYWQDLMYAAIGVPREYLQAERTGGGILGKNLAMEDIRFARSVKKIQQAIARGLVRLVRVELALHGFDPLEEEFEVRVGTISFLEEQQRLEALEQATRVASSLSRLGQDTGLAASPEWQDFVLDTIITFVGSSVGLEELRDKVAAGLTTPEQEGGGRRFSGREKEILTLLTENKSLDEDQRNEALRAMISTYFVDLGAFRLEISTKNRDVPGDSQALPIQSGIKHFRELAVRIEEKGLTSHFAKRIVSEDGQDPRYVEGAFGKDRWEWDEVDLSLHEDGEPWLELDSFARREIVDGQEVEGDAFVFVEGAEGKKYIVEAIYENGAEEETVTEE